MLITTTELIAILRDTHRALLRLWPEGHEAPDWELWSTEALAETAHLRNARFLRRPASALEVDGVVEPTAPAPAEPLPGES